MHITTTISGDIYWCIAHVLMLNYFLRYYIRIHSRVFKSELEGDTILLAAAEEIFSAYPLYSLKNFLICSIFMFSVGFISADNFKKYPVPKIRKHRRLRLLAGSHLWYRCICNIALGSRFNFVKFDIPKLTLNSKAIRGC